MQCYKEKITVFALERKLGVDFDAPEKMAQNGEGRDWGASEKPESGNGIIK